jgi:hypothetical protein
MPFREYAAFFQCGGAKDALGCLRYTWKELSADRPDLDTEEKVTLMKKNLLHRILASATAGPAKLCLSRSQLTPLKTHRHASLPRLPALTSRSKVRKKEALAKFFMAHAPSFVAATTVPA